MLHLLVWNLISVKKKDSIINVTGSSPKIDTENDENEMKEF